MDKIKALILGTGIAAWTALTLFIACLVFAIIGIVKILPECKETWTEQVKKEQIIMDKIKVLVVVDCQNDFIDGTLANPVAQERVPNIVKKINEFEGGFIFATRDTHESNYLETPEGKKLPVTHCVVDTKGWEINADVAKALEDANQRENVIVKVIDKPTFGSLDLMEEILLLEANTTEPIPMEVEFVGFCTDICVASNAIMLKAYTYDFAELTVDASCCAGVTPESHTAALNTMKMCQINVVNE